MSAFGSARAVVTPLWTCRTGLSGRVGSPPTWLDSLLNCNVALVVQRTRRRVRPYSPASRERLRGALNRTRRLGRRLAAVFALLSCSCRAQTGRSGSQTRQAGRSREPSAPGDAAHARRSGPSHHGCLRLLGLDGPVDGTAAG